jgi:hypothetical protein
MLWINNNGFFRILAYNNSTKFKGAVITLYKARGAKIINGRAYYPESQGSIKVINKIFKARLSAT